jgi:hypothetical protein
VKRVAKTTPKMASKLENGPRLLPAVEARIDQKQVFLKNKGQNGKWQNKGARTHIVIARRSF